MTQNLCGMDISEYNPLSVTTSFKSNLLFQNIGIHTHGYKYQGGAIIPLGFTYGGNDNEVSGGDKVSSYSNSRKFEEGYTVGVSGDVPAKKAMVGLGVEYSKMKKEGNSENDIYFSSSAEVKVYTVSLLPHDLADVHLTTRFREAVKSVNTAADVENEIIKIFGTHYAESVTYGGFWRSWKHVSQKDYYSMEQQNIDVSASVKVSTPGQKITETTKSGLASNPNSSFTTQNERNEGASSGNVAFNFKHVQKDEYRDKLSNSIGNYKSVGGRGDDAAAIKTKLRHLSKLIYPHIFKDGSTEAQLGPKRDLIDRAIKAYIDRVMPPLSQQVPEYKLYKAKLAYAKRVDKTLDDANQMMKGFITLQQPGSINNDLWRANDFVMINERVGELILADQKWTIIKVPKINGVAQDITLTANINLENKDDCCGHDPHLGTFPVRLREVNGNKEFKHKVSHTAFFEETHWEVKFIIQEIPDLDYVDASIPELNTDGSIKVKSVTRSGQISSTPAPSKYIIPGPKLSEEEFNRDSRAEVLSIKSATTTSTPKATTVSNPATSTNSIKMASVPGYARIQNSGSKTNYIHNQNGTLEQGPIQSNWESAQWKILPADGGYVRIQNKLHPDKYLHNENGKIEAGPMLPNWWSAQWRIVPAEGGYVRIQSKYKPTQYLHNQNGKIEVGPIQNTWASAMWKVE